MKLRNWRLVARPPEEFYMLVAPDSSGRVTGREVREACAHLGWTPRYLGRRLRQLGACPISVRVGKKTVYGWGGIRLVGQPSRP